VSAAEKMLKLGNRCYLAFDIDRCLRLVLHAPF